MSRSLKVVRGDCLRFLPLLEDDTFDSCVTDPPYHLTSISKRFGRKDATHGGGNDALGRMAGGFMGKTWDGGDIAHDPATWAEVLRVVKPGAWLLAFGGTRTAHRLACAIEDAGWEVRDRIAWLYAQGFPAGSLNVSKAINKELGAEPAAAWDGWGTRLSPAHEPIVVARKPLAERSIVRQVLSTGTGALNVDGCRVGTGKGGERTGEASAMRTYRKESGAFGLPPGPRGGNAAGRWPPNVVLSHGVTEDGHDACAEGCLPGCPVLELDERAKFFPVFRFQAKPTVKEKEAGLNHLPLGTLHRVNAGGLENEPRFAPTPRRNRHNTVKPVGLMRWLVRLVTPRGGEVLDPFAGSGTTGAACAHEGSEFLGVELDDDGDNMVEVARARIMHARREALCS